jgi:hypothetical protein
MLLFGNIFCMDFKSMTANRSSCAGMFGKGKLNSKKFRRLYEETWVYAY